MFKLITSLIVIMLLSGCMRMHDVRPGMANTFIIADQNFSISHNDNPIKIYGTKGIQNPIRGSITIDNVHYQVITVVGDENRDRYSILVDQNGKINNRLLNVMSNGLYDGDIIMIWKFDIEPPNVSFALVK